MFQKDVTADLHSRLHYWPSVVVHFLSVEVCVGHNKPTHIDKYFRFAIYEIYMITEHLNHK